MDLQHLYENSNNLVKQVSLNSKRHLYEKIDWKLKLIGILGQRGVGKTTMMLQYIKKFFGISEKAMYVSLDSPYMQNISLFDFAKEFEQYGGEVLCLDEVHKYDNWSVHIKKIYDSLKIKLIFSGSSLLQIEKQNADLSRRAVIYHLENLSFREYLDIINVKTFKAYTIEEIVENHIEIATQIKTDIKPLIYFEEYLKYGCYPFIVENKVTYHQKIIQNINLILESDLLYVNKIDIQKIIKLKKLLYMLAINVPFVPNITDISKAIDISRQKVHEYLAYLESAKITNSIKNKEKVYKIMSKPEKLFMQNTNISYAITNKIDKENIIESFFANQVKNYYVTKVGFTNDAIYSSNREKFLVNNKYIFEIVGKNKNFNRPSGATTPQGEARGQIKDIKNSFIAADGIEIGFGTKIPLWLFGFLY